MAEEVAKSVVTMHVSLGVALVRIRNPPVNALSQQVRRSLLRVIVKASRNKRVRAIVITGDGIFFSAGADISEFEKIEAASPSLPEVVGAIEQCSKPVIAVINGVAFGGGLEIALACHYRICVQGSRFGLPEVNLGVIPGAGGTQRLPRLVPLEDAMMMVTSGRPIGSDRAREIGLVDAVCDGSNLQQVMTQVNAIATRWLSTCSPSELQVRKTVNRPLDRANDPTAVYGIASAVLSKLPRVHLGGQAARVAVDVMLAGYRMPFQAALKYEEAAFVRLMNSHQSRGLRHVFFAERESTRLPSFATNGDRHSIRKVGIVGAGTMGAGIATSFLLAGFEVVLSDLSAQTLQRAEKYIQHAAESAVRKKRLSERQAQQLLKSLRLTTELSSHHDRDLVVECVFESMNLKKQIFQELSTIVPPNAILCSNTSTLDVDEIAGASSDSSRVMGMHFFSPADVMKLVECVRGKHTSPATIAAVMSTVKRLKKTPVLVGNCHGFVGNRMIFSYSCEAMFLLEEGATVQQVDAAMQSLGFKMGPFQMADMAGNDVGYNIRKELALTDPATRDPELRYSTLADQLCELKRFGLKTGKGWYQYTPDSREPIPDAIVDALVQRHRRSLKIVKTHDFSAVEIWERLLSPLINEGFKILEEGIATRPGDIDVIFTYGYGWPPFLGGPMHYAQHHMGLPRLLANLQQLCQAYPRSSYFEPSTLLQFMVANRLHVEDICPAIIGAAVQSRQSRL